MVSVTVELLRALGVHTPTAVTWAPYLDSACRRHSINTRLRLAAFLANALHETSELEELVESLNYAAAALLRTWPTHFTAEQAQRLGRTPEHAANQPAIAELAYGGRMGNKMPGDGWLFRGRGIPQITGRENYTRTAHLIGCDLDALPSLLEHPPTAAEAGAAWWQAMGCNEAADGGDIAVVRHIVNGGQNGIADVTAYYTRALRLIQEGPEVTPAPSPPPAPRRGVLASLLAIFTRTNAHG